MKNEEEEFKFSPELDDCENFDHLNQEFKDFGQRPSSINNTVKKFNFPRKLPQENENILKHSNTAVKQVVPASKAFYEEDVKN